jgi:hypothetical protein
MRPMTLLLCLALAGCAGADAAHSSFAPEATPAATSPAAAAGDAVAQAEKADDPPLLPGPMGQPAARKPKGKPAAAKPDSGPKEEWWKDGGVTREKINAMCWMKYENGRRDMPVEKRADLVDICVKETLKEHPLR